MRASGVCRMPYARERGLSVIEPGEDAAPQGQYRAQQRGQTTLRDVVRRDMDEAIRRALSYGEFLRELRRMGYQVKNGGQCEAHRCTPVGRGGRFIRLDSLGDGYGEADIRARIKGAWQRPLQSAKRKMYRVRPDANAEEAAALFSAAVPILYVPAAGAAAGAEHFSGSTAGDAEAGAIPGAVSVSAGKPH